MPVTPNIGLNIPTEGTTSWDVPVNANFTLLDLLLSGNQAIPGLSLETPLPVEDGGSGTASPSLVAGSNVFISGSWPNQTVAAVSGGGAVSKLTGTATFDPGSIQDTALVTLGTTVTVTGASVGDICQCYTSPVPPAGCDVLGRVTATNTVTLKFLNLSGSTQSPGSTVFNAVVLH